MSEMQEFYETYIAEDQSSPYQLLTEVDPEDILSGGIPAWDGW